MSEDADSLLHTPQVNFSIKSLKSGLLLCTQFFTLIQISTAPKCEREVLVSILFNIIELIEGGVANLGSWILRIMYLLTHSLPAI